MDINSSKHILNQLLEKSNYEKIGTEVYCITPMKDLDIKYKSFEATLEEKNLKEWFIKHTLNELKKLKIDGEFYSTKYNNELKINESIAEIDTDESEGILQKNLKKLKKAISKNEGELNTNVKFTLLKMRLKDKAVYFGYYKGIKNYGNKKKYGLIRGKEFHEIGDDIIELGGPIHFIIYENCIYVINPQMFEYAFQYSDHITKKRDENLKAIVKIDIFDEKSKKIFLDNSSHHLMARGIAQITDTEIGAIKDNFKDRCNELIEIKKKIDEDPQSENDIKEEIGVLMDLMDLINLEKQQIILKEESNVKPLVWLFEDKIMESFLTKKIQTILAKTN